MTVKAEENIIPFPNDQLYSNEKGFEENKESKELIEEPNQTVSQDSNTPEGVLENIDVSEKVKEVSDLKENVDNSVNKHIDNENIDEPVLENSNESIKQEQKEQKVNTDETIDKRTSNFRSTTIEKNKVSVEAIFRLYNPNTGEHHYTSSRGENNYLEKVGWISEGIGWYAPVRGDEVYRLYNPNNGNHHYTKSKGESNFLSRVGWIYEGIGWHSGGTKSIYRLYNPYAKGAGSHHYTGSKGESNYLDKIGWNYEGIGWYAIEESVLDDSITKPNNKLDVEMTSTGLQVNFSSNTITDYSKIRFSVWSEKNGKDDLLTYQSDFNGNATIPFLNHNDFGLYNIEAYFENSNKILVSKSIELETYKTNTEISKVNDTTYTVRVNNVPMAINGIVVPVWTSKNGQDDIKWYEGKKIADGEYLATILLGNHNLEEGFYNVHVYGKGFKKLAPLAATEGFTTKLLPTQTGNINISNVDKKNYSFTATVSEVGHKLGIKSIDIAVWSDPNGQDDIEWYRAIPQADGTYKAIVHLATHEFVNGNYNIHVYYNLKNNTKSGVGALTKKIQVPAPREFIQKELQSIRSKFNELFGGVPGNKSLVVMPTNGTELLSINDNVQRSASTIKLFIMAAAFAKSERGELNLSQAYTIKNSDLVEASTALAGKAGVTYTLDDITRMMVQYSDNTATNIMISAIGGVDAVNSEIRRLGYTKTTLNRYMRIQSQIDRGLENYISAVEATDLLKNIYNQSSTASTQSDKSMLNKLSNNFYKLWLPANIQSIAQTWDKPGNDPKFGVENDIAIIKRNGRAYAVGLLTQGNRGNGLTYTNKFAQFGKFIASLL
ncbi:GBS Bsp-like repeat-containing protein [Streptococcus pacificus]|uniref:GBS Bsp-like repeat-containing protein n=1 Tax=Streptococcus pacificus TaxID=2740577 RepID=A0ABS0ZHI5_9STRE|nr:GBS Bsp-like repeat-containing protein [Streptococcus pacificus]MBJ8325318.1 GBS Bsp-like repeat-containing protein [Streptococcus pacificus]